jgi:hypothetical protein
MDPIDEGMDPLRKLLKRNLRKKKRRTIRDSQQLKAEQISYKTVKFVSRPIDDGMVPRNRFWVKYLKGNISSNELSRKVHEHLFDLSQLPNGRRDRTTQQVVGNGTISSK